MIPSNGLPLSSFPPPPRLQPTPTTTTTMTTSEQPSSNSMTSSSSSSLAFPPNTLLSSIVSSTSSGTSASGSSSLLPDFYAGLLRSPLAAMAASAATTATPLPLLHSSTTPTPSLPPFPLSPPVRQPFQSPPSSNSSPPVSSSPTSAFSSPSTKLLAAAAAVNPIQLPPLSSLLTRSASDPVNSVQALLSLPDSSSPASHSTPNLPTRTSSIGGDPPPPPSPLQQRKPSPVREPVTSEASLVEQGWRQIRNWARGLGYVADQALLDIQEYGPEPREQSIRLHSAVGLWLKLEKELADVLGQVPNPLLHGAPSDSRRESLAAAQAPQHQSGSTNNHSVAATGTHFPPPLTPTRKSPNRTPPPNDPFPGFALATGPGQAQPSSSDSSLMCEVCLVTESPEWRNGPNGSKTLCNACGLKFAKRRREGGELQTILSLKRRRRKSE